MAGRPITKDYKRKIKASGGVGRVFDQLAEGKLLTTIAREMAVSVAFLHYYVVAAPGGRAAMWMARYMDQVKGDGFNRQSAAIRAYASANGITIKAIHKEEGVSGTLAAEDRPAWAELIKALHANGVKALIVERLDRLARDLMVQEEAIADLQRHGFTLISVAEPDLMATDPTRILMRQIIGAVAQYDKSMVVSKLAGARARKRAAAGRCEGRKPFGHYPGEAAIVDRLKAIQAEGMGFDRIAASANAEGLPTRTGKPWHGVVVNRILSQGTR